MVSPSLIFLKKLKKKMAKGVIMARKKGRFFVSKMLKT